MQSLARLEWCLNCTLYPVCKLATRATSNGTQWFFIAIRYVRTLFGGVLRQLCRRGGKTPLSPLSAGLATKRVRQRSNLIDGHDQLGT